MTALQLQCNPSYVIPLDWVSTSQPSSPLFHTKLAFNDFITNNSPSSSPLSSHHGYCKSRVRVRAFIDTVSMRSLCLLSTGVTPTFIISTNYIVTVSLPYGERTHIFIRFCDWSNVNRFFRTVVKYIVLDLHTLILLHTGHIDALFGGTRTRNYCRLKMI